MRYCPTCDSEYREGVETCVDDGTRLLGRAEWEEALRLQGRSPNPRLLRNVAIVDTRFAADAIADALADEGFRAGIVETKGQIVGPLTSPVPGQWFVVVPDDEAERASVLAAEYQRDLAASTVEAEAAADREELATEPAPMAP